MKTYKQSTITRNSIQFFQVLIVLISIGAVALMLWEPHLEGRNVNATLFEIYFNDPFLAYAYVASIPFFVALYQAFKVLEYAGANQLFTERSVRSLRTIRYCALILIASIVAAEIYIVTAMRGEDDIAGGVAMGLFMMTGSLIAAISASLLEKRLQRSIAH